MLRHYAFIHCPDGNLSEISNEKKNRLVEKNNEL
jgi:hypothetical protein